MVAAERTSAVAAHSIPAEEDLAADNLVVGMPAEDSPGQVRALTTLFGWRMPTVRGDCERGRFSCHACPTGHLTCTTASLVN